MHLTTIGTGTGGRDVTHFERVYRLEPNRSFEMITGFCGSGLNENVRPSYITRIDHIIEAKLNMKKNHLVLTITRSYKLGRLPQGQTPQGRT